MHMRKCCASTVCPVRPESNIRAFTDGILASYLVGATDSHAKNYSLLLDGASVRLAPLYDLASVFPYLGHGKQIIMPLWR